ncbi:MAG: hypothetical protein MUF48_20700 [Pirellulaceae bacterium]|nr:hypothetical protein [Pirellulaceae bacterium]
MRRRRFIRLLTQAAAAVTVTNAAENVAARRQDESPQDAGKLTFRDRGWVWEGQGIDPHVPPSIYGLGQGARYFGLSRANFLFHPNDVHALRLLQDYDEVTCDISKWGWEWNADGRPACQPQGDPETVQSEGERVARLAKQFPNVTGVYCDDLAGLMTRFGYGPERFASIRAAIRQANPSIKLWTVVYAHELGQADFWKEMRPHIDVVSFWIWDSNDISQMPAYIDQCRELFHAKAIVMGVYLRDYGKAAPIPVERVVQQMEAIARLIDEGQLTGYAILGAVLIDGHRPQADAVRDFISAQSASG